MSLCYKRSGPRMGPRWDRAGDRAESSSTECLNNTECLPPSQPTTPHLLPTFNTPGRTSSVHRQSVPLSSFPQYRSYSTGSSYLPPPADQAGGAPLSSLPLVAEIPAPGPFNSHGQPESITC